MKSNDLKEKWAQFRSQKGFLQRLDPSHPMDFFAGVNDNGCDEIVLLTSVEPTSIKSSKSLEIVKGQRKDGKWATQIASIDKSNEDIFARLCIDLVEVSQNVKSEKEGINLITNRYLAWQKLFASLHSDLSKSVLKGMFGELKFAKDILFDKYSYDDVMNAWLGPNGADRDYIFEDYWFEVKSVSTGKDAISISSLNQLDTEEKGYLVKFDVDESSPTDPQAISIFDMVQSMRSILRDAPNAAYLFEQKLVSLGYIDKETYKDIFFVARSRTFYYVEGEFPKLTPNLVPNGVIAAKYDISAACISPWKIDEENIWN